MCDCKPYVLTFINGAYMPLFDIWLSYVKQNSPSDLRVHVYALDADVHIDDDRVDVHAFHVPPHTDVREYRQQLWKMRLALMTRLVVDEGKTILHSDVDAFWCASNVVGKLCAISADMVCSAGRRDIPVFTLKRYGFSLCPGLFLLHSTQAGKRLISAWNKTLLQRSAGLYDDQIALNILLIRQKADFGVPDTDGRQQADFEIPDADGRRLAVLAELKATIAVLPLEKYTRRPEERGEAYVFHPNLRPTNMPDKLELLATFGIRKQ